MKAKNSLTAVDAMLTDRPYRKALSLAQCQMELQEQAGKQFDPGIIARMEAEGFTIFKIGEAASISYLTGWRMELSE